MLSIGNHLWCHHTLPRPTPVLETYYFLSILCIRMRWLLVFKNSVAVFEGKHVNMEIANTHRVLHTPNGGKLYTSHHTRPIWTCMLISFFSQSVAAQSRNWKGNTEGSSILKLLYLEKKKHCPRYWTPNLQSKPSASTTHYHRPFTL